ncbi:Zn-finger nucleic acid-binding protein [Paenarthrobacter nitroguajacolicus]|uniref:TFIIB-type zinc ribbon-containing protein n=1 Tax=Paenarthrobacter TaxID=1742992 RepID=UPI00285BBBDD|nr:zf-TFIIB domain-containing protein [Paenarthrobacter nitroguajacolicus]MDR6988505.1 Zn-finger nucleic acid-binding protein [Paenarthrobacter nitroguajacolicus]
MKCPVDSIDLVMSERSGVEIDYCPQCRGVWLDRGELDKIIDRVNADSAPRSRPTPAPQQPPIAPPPLYNPFESRPQQPRYDDRDRRDYDRRDGDRRDGYDRDGYGRKRKKKEGFLGDLFDF